MGSDGAAVVLVPATMVVVVVVDVVIVVAAAVVLVAPWLDFSSCNCRTSSLSKVDNDDDDDNGDMTGWSLPTEDLLMSGDPFAHCL